MNTVRPKKHLGQHFLKEDDIARRITEALTGHGGYETVFEVGPGTGALTTHLLGRTDFALWCVELDREAATHLRERFPALGDRLIPGDMLRIDLDARFTEPPSSPAGRFAIIGNFPYNISTQLVFQVLAHRERCTEVVGMFQKEVADRLRAAPGSRTYGITSVLAQAFYQVEQVMVVEPGSFIPPPKVRSAVVRMRRNTVDRLPCDEDLFFRLVKTAFNQRRKTLRNALKGFPGLPDGVPPEFAGKRAEQLSVGDFVALARITGDRSFSENP